MWIVASWVHGIYSEMEEGNEDHPFGGEFAWWFFGAIALGAGGWALLRWLQDRWLRGDGGITTCNWPAGLEMLILGGMFLFVGTNAPVEVRFLAVATVSAALFRLFCPRKWPNPSAGELGRQ